VLLLEVAAIEHAGELDDALQLELAPAAADAGPLEGVDQARGLVQVLQLSAVNERVSRIAIRCQTEFTQPYLRLIDLGYRVHWTDLRMLLQGFPQPFPGEGIVMSNWEI
jgi:hypothetical protein